MSGIDAFDFLQSIGGFDRAKGSNFRIGKIDSGYTSGRPRVQFDGESTTSTKTHTYLASYSPSANDRVLMARVGRAWVILGEIV